MPYIPLEDREKFDELVLSLGDQITTTSELSHVIEKLVVMVTLESDGSLDTYLGIVGVLEAVKLEFVRTILNPYLDAQMEQYGDLFDD